MPIPSRPIMNVHVIIPCLAAALATLGSAAAAPSVEEALAVQPKQKRVDYDRLKPDDAKSATMSQEKEGGVSALVVRGPGGQVLRAFADTNGNRVVDRWSYYKDGVEVYRDIDSDHDTKVDQSRWLNSAGGRWAVYRDANDTIDAWLAISAEEATAEVVDALRDRDAAAFARLLPTKEDLKTAGFEGERLAELLQHVAAAPANFAKLAAAQKQFGPDAKWAGMLTPQPPGLVPAGSAGTEKDVQAYDNVAALVEGKNGSGQVFIGALVRCGDAWRPIDAPQMAGEQAGAGESFAFFAPRIAGAASAAGPAEDESLKPLLTKLRDIEARLSTANDAARNDLLTQQIAVLEEVRAAAADADKTFWTKQLAETLAAAVQDATVPEGLGKLEKIAAEVAGDEETAAFVAFRLAQARYAAGMQQSGADVEKVQAAWIEELGRFVEQHPRAADAAEAMLQLGIADEFSGREKEALDRYAAIIKDFPDAVPARKARGAARRLESVGKPLSLTGTALDGKQFSLESLRGTPVLVHYWATWCEPCKVDIAQIRELYAKYGSRKFAVVGVTLDSDKADLVKYLQAKPIPWPQLYEKGGFDGRLAEELGVLTLPTMLLIDAEGKVVDRNLVITDLEKKLDQLLGGK